LGPSKEEKHFKVSNVASILLHVAMCPVAQIWDIAQTQKGKKPECFFSHTSNQKTPRTGTVTQMHLMVGPFTQIKSTGTKLATLLPRNKEKFGQFWR
jgi:hypothetical protein